MSDVFIIFFLAIIVLLAIIIGIMLAQNKRWTLSDIFQRYRQNRRRQRMNDKRKQEPSVSESGTTTPYLTRKRETDAEIDDSRYRKSGITEKVLGHVSWKDE